MPQERISRRDFLKLVGVGVAGMFWELRIGPENVEASNLQPTPENVLGWIRSNCGQIIPTKPDPLYFKESQRVDDNGKVVNTVEKNIMPTLEEAQIMAEAFNKLPRFGKAAPYILPVRTDDPNALIGGDFETRNWPAIRLPSKFPDFPRDRFLSDRNAIGLTLPSRAMSEKLPEIPALADVLPLLEQQSLVDIGVNVKQIMEVPWTTYGERLKQTCVHEMGHVLADLASWAIAKGNTEEKKAGEYWSRQGFYIYMMNTIDVENPYYAGFAEVNGWFKEPFYDFIKRFNPTDAKSLLDRGGPDLKKFVWSRDTKVWGDEFNRKIRLTPYASYASIHEASQEFLVGAVLYPKLLTYAERVYFAKVLTYANKGTEALSKFFIQEHERIFGSSDNKSMRPRLGEVNGVLFKYPNKLSRRERDVYRV